MLRCRSPDLTVLLNQHASNHPGTAQRQEGEAGGCTKANTVAGLVKLEPEVGTVDVSDLDVLLAMRKAF
jgi:hypothetical protein